VLLRALRDDRPSTGPLGRSAKAELVSGSSSALLGRRRRVSVGWVAASRGWPPVPGLLTTLIGWLVVIGWLVLAATRTGWVPPGSCDFMPWTGCVAASAGWIAVRSAVGSGPVRGVAV
jgi:hypothetical protein